MLFWRQALLPFSKDFVLRKKPTAIYSDSAVTNIHQGQSSYIDNLDLSKIKNQNINILIGIFDNM